MQLYPAIDLKNGQCVRLRQGKFQDMKVYSHHPEQVALHWQEQGATYLHLVDLDGALAGRSVNEEAICKIVEQTGIPVQAGGGIRTLEAVGNMLKLGVSRVIIGTKAVEDPGFILQAIRTFGPERIVAGVDAKDGMVAVEGWEKVSAMSASQLCRDMKAYGVRHIVYTDISRDGMLSGPNVAQTRKLTVDTGLDIIASGGVSSLEDLVQLKEAGVKGAIIGKALYEQKVDLKAAITLLE